MPKLRLGLLLFAASLYGQTFDVVSVKPVAPPNGRGGFMMPPPSGGPGAKDPGRIHYPYVSMKNLLMTAYDVKDYQISGPDWLDGARFDVTATMPPSTTTAQFHVMLQNLLAERFKLTLHRETRELPMYSLVVAKNGAKLKESAPIEAPIENADPPALPPPPPVQVKMGPDGFPILPPRPPGSPVTMLNMNGRARIEGQGNTMQELADRLTGVLGRPVMDATALKAKYDFKLAFSPEGTYGPNGPPATPEPDAIPDIFSAIQAQLGLRLESKKGPVEIIVIDRIEKTPTEN